MIEILPQAQKYFRNLNHVQKYNIFLKFYYIKFQKRDAWLVLNFIQYCTHFFSIIASV